MPPNLTGKLSFKTLNFAFIPADDAAKTFNDNKELLAYLKQALGVEVRGTVGTSYSAVVEAQRAKKVELGYYGPFSYILAHPEIAYRKAGSRRQTRTTCAFRSAA